MTSTPSVTGVDTSVSLLKAIGKFHFNGVKVDVARLNHNGNTIPGLPTYPWNHDKSILMMESARTRL